MPEQEKKASLMDVQRALGCKPVEFKELPPKDRDDLKRYLEEEWQAEGTGV